MLHSVGGASELADLSPPTLRGQGQPHGEQPGVWDLRLLPRGRKEEEQRDSAPQPQDMRQGAPAVLLAPGDIWGTVGGRSDAPAPGTAPDKSPLREGQTPEMKDSC